jgi:plastocyanin
VRSRVFLLLFVGLAGAAVAALPSLATGSSPPSSASFTAVDYAWEVSGGTSTQATIAQGGTATFSYPSGYSHHNADFSGGPQPSSCTQTAGPSSGPVPPLPAQPTAPGWGGTCTFNTPGTYTFHCDLHPFMSATIVVQAPGTTTTTTTGTTSTGHSSTTTPGTTTPGTSTAPGGGPGPGGSPLAGTAAKAIAIATRQRGAVLHGSVRVSPAGAGGQLTVDLFATRTALTSARRPGLARVGQLARRSVPAGIVRFSISLDAAARRALGRHGRLKLTVRIAVVSPRGVKASVTRTVILLRAAARRAAQA